MRHHFDGISLVLGLLFAAVAVAALDGWTVDVLVASDWWTPEAVVATASIVLGLLVLAVVVTMLARRRAVDRAAADDAGGRSDRANDGPAADRDAPSSEPRLDA